MVSKCDKNKNMAYETQPSVTDDHILTSSGISRWADAQQRYTTLTLSIRDVRIPPELITERTTTPIN